MDPDPSRYRPYRRFSVEYEISAWEQHHLF